MTQVTRAFVTDDSLDPIEGAKVTFHRISTGDTFFVDTLANGEALAGLEEDEYTISVVANDFQSPPASKFEVSVPPAPTSALFNPPAQANPLIIGATAKNIKLSFDSSTGELFPGGGSADELDDPTAAFTAVLVGQEVGITGSGLAQDGTYTVVSVVSPTRLQLSSTFVNEAALAYKVHYTIDVSGGDDVATDSTEIAANINTATGTTIATAVQGEIRLTSPTTGSASEITVFNTLPLADDATDIVFGLTLGAGDVTVTGADTPTDWNDFDLVLTPVDVLVASDPNHCVLWAKFWRHELSEPLVGATILVLVDPRPTTIDVGLDVGDSFYATTDENGIVQFELMRGVKVRVSMIWQDKVFDFVVPDQASANIETLIAKVVTGLELVCDDAISINVGAERFFTAKKTFSDGSVLNNRTGVTFISSNIEVASFDPLRPTTLLANQASPPTAIVHAEFTNTRGEIIQPQDITVTVV
jgi:hypothetical protein